MGNAIGELPTKAMLVYSYIVQYKRDHDGNSPSYRNIGEALGYSGPATIQHYIAMLKKAGAIRLGESGIEIGGKYNPPRKVGL